MKNNAAATSALDYTNWKKFLWLKWKVLGKFPGYTKIHKNFIFAEVSSPQFALSQTQLPLRTLCSMLVDSVLKQNEVNLRRQKWNFLFLVKKWCSAKTIYFRVTCFVIFVWPRIVIRPVMDASESG